MGLLHCGKVVYTLRATVVCTSGKRHCFDGIRVVKTIPDHRRRCPAPTIAGGRVSSLHRPTFGVQVGRSMRPVGGKCNCSLQ